MITSSSLFSYTTTGDQERAPAPSSPPKRPPGDDYNLSPSRHVASNDHELPLPLEEALVLLAQAEEERRAADQELDDVLTELGFAVWRSGE